MGALTYTAVELGMFVDHRVLQRLLEHSNGGRIFQRHFAWLVCFIVAKRGGIAVGVVTLICNTQHGH